MAPLDSARAKLARATKHLHTLEEVVPAFLREHDYPVVHEVDRAAFYHRWKVELGTPFPECWALVIGDMAHNMRSALDHIAWELAGSDPADTWTQFPIYAEETKFAQAGRVVKTIPKRPLALIKWLQPYRRPNPYDDRLWTIHALDAEDKHKTITILLAAMVETEYFPVAPTPSRVQHEVTFTFGPFDPSIKDAVIAEGRLMASPLDGSPAHTDVEMNFQPTFGIAIRADSAGITWLPGLVVLHEALACAWQVWEWSSRYADPYKR